jgi:hypothetical protein
MAEHDDETLPLLTLPRVMAADTTRQTLQVTTDISVGGAQAIGGDSLDLVLGRLVSDGAEVQSPIQRSQEPQMSSALRRSVSNPFLSSR